MKNLYIIFALLSLLLTGTSCNNEWQESNSTIMSASARL